MDWAFKYYLKLSLNPLKAWRKLRETHFKSGRYDEVFVKQDYYWLYERIRPNTTLLDIGASIGDTAIYFAMNPDVKRVIAYEPTYPIFQQAKEALSKNPLSHKVTLKNAAVVGSTGGTFSSYNAETTTEAKSQTVTLASALRNLHNVAIKCDCEGCERNLFTDAVMKDVYAVELEYHNCKEDVMRILRSKGFKLTSKASKMKGLGYIYASR